VSALRTIRARVLAVVLGAFTIVMVLGLAALTIVLFGTLRNQAGSTATASVNWLAEELAQRSPATIVREHARDDAPERVIQFLDPEGHVSRRSSFSIPAQGGARFGDLLGKLTAGVLIITALAATGSIVCTGHTGAKAAWADQVAATNNVATTGGD